MDFASSRGLCKFLLVLIPLLLADSWHGDIHGENTSNEFESLSVFVT
jgi:hypothetical protein